MSHKRAFGELELAILNIIRSRTYVTVRDVHEALGGTDKYTTIMTVMNRMVEKKSLERKRVGPRYEYCVAAHNQPKQRNMIERFKDRVFGGRSFALISYLLEASDELTEDELTRIERMIAEAKEMKNR